VAAAYGAVELIIQPRDKDLAGFSVRRVRPTTERKKVGPWVFFDHMGPATSRRAKVSTYGRIPMSLSLPYPTSLKARFCRQRKVYAETLYVEAHLQAGQTITLPNADERAVYVAQGTMKARDTVIPEHSMAVIANQSDIVLEAATEARIAIIGGESMERRYIEWNFVSRRMARIERAKENWNVGRFAKIPGDEDEYIPLPA